MWLLVWLWQQAPRLELKVNNKKVFTYQFCQIVCVKKKTQHVHYVTFEVVENPISTCFQAVSR